MNIEELRDYCMAKKGVTESFPFDDKALVFKVMNKMFCITNVEQYTGFSAKCDPQRAIELRENYPHGILPGWHLNKQHWNSVRVDEGVPEDLLYELVDHSYDLIVASLPKKLRQELAEMT